MVGVMVPAVHGEAVAAAMVLPVDTATTRRAAEATARREVDITIQAAAATADRFARQFVQRFVVFEIAGTVRADIRPAADITVRAVALQGATWFITVAVEAAAEDLPRLTLAVTRIRQS